MVLRKILPLSLAAGQAAEERCGLRAPRLLATQSVKQVFDRVLRPPLLWVLLVSVFHLRLSASAFVPRAPAVLSDRPRNIGAGWRLDAGATIRLFNIVGRWHPAISCNRMPKLLHPVDHLRRTRRIDRRVHSDARVDG